MPTLQPPPPSPEPPVPARMSPPVQRSLSDYDQTYSIMRDFLDAAGDRTDAEDFTQAMVNADSYVMNLSQPDRRHLLTWIDDYMLTPPHIERFGEVRDNGADRFRIWLKENS